MSRRFVDNRRHVLRFFPCWPKEQRRELIPPQPTWSGHTTVLNSGVAIVSNKVNAHIDLVCVVLMLLVSIGTDSVVSVDRVGYETRHLECKTPGSEWIGLQ